jgi:hypothetical protein
MDVHYQPLTTLDIRRLLKRRKIFRGVFPADMLPQIVEYPSVVVANTDPSSLPGAHWIAMHFDARRRCAYFDSYGSPPTVEQHISFIKRNSVSHTWNKKELQSMDSSLCGHYCCIFAVNCSKNNTMSKFLSLFEEGQVYCNDAKTLLIFRKLFKTLGKSSFPRSAKSFTCCSRRKNCIPSRSSLPMSKKRKASAPARR